MRECITIHVGQAGCQIGERCWELFCLEHGIDYDGFVSSSNQSIKNNNNNNNEDLSPFFAESSAGKKVPRSVFVDLEPTVVEEIKSGPIGKLFPSDVMIWGKEDAANNFARGHFTIGREMLEPTLRRVSRLAETCDALQVGIKCI